MLRISTFLLLAVTFLTCSIAASATRALGQETAPSDSVASSSATNSASPETAGDAADASPEAAGAKNWMDRINDLFGKYVVEKLAKVLFYDFGSQEWAGTSIPFVVLWLAGGALFFTVRMMFINVRGFWHAIRLTKGDYDIPGEQGEVSHFQALASALSATVGLGNIAGVAIAVSNGGPGAVFWMIMAGLFGMSSKFTECTLGQMYRHVAPDGTVSGGPMHYLRDGMAKLADGFGQRSLGLAFGSFLSVVFAVICMGGSFGGGCAFQVGQSLGPIREQIPILDDMPWIYGLVMAVMVGLVIIGGIKRIGATAGRIVPLMCGIYVATALYILLSNYHQIIPAFRLIFDGAFSLEAGWGGFLGVMVIGIQRAAFSNEAGIGSASIAHSAARTEEPVSEGIVALLEPFIDTVVVCTMTGLVIVITGAYDASNKEFADLIHSEEGAALTSKAFASSVSWFPWILCAAVFMFAYSTMISWSYYGERCWAYLFGPRTSWIYKTLFLVAVMLGSIVTASNVKDFSDLMILSMAFPNILGVVLLSGQVRRALNDYWGKYKRGDLEVKRA